MVQHLRAHVADVLRSVEGEAVVEAGSVGQVHRGYDAGFSDPGGCGPHSIQPGDRWMG